MQPQIRYTKTSDGVNIAYYAIGSGQPTVFLPPDVGSHIELEWRIDDLRAGYERIARNNTLVRYDPRGFGLSDRDWTDFSLDAQVRDLEAVVDVLDLPPAVFMSFGPASMTALAYASLHPERAAALVLWEGVASGEATSTFNEFMVLASTNFPVFKHLLAGQMGFGQSSIDELAHLLDESMTQESCIAVFAAQVMSDVTDRLSTVTAPTLVLHRRGAESLAPAEACRRLAAALPNGTFTTVEGSRFAFTDRASGEAIASILRANLTQRAADAEPRAKSTNRADAGDAPRPVGAQTGGTAVILFTDVVSSTALTERMGDAAFRDTSRALDGELRAAIRRTAVHLSMGRCWETA